MLTASVNKLVVCCVRLLFSQKQHDPIRKGIEKGSKLQLPQTPALGTPPDHRIPAMGAFFVWEFQRLNIHTSYCNHLCKSIFLSHVHPWASSILLDLHDYQWSQTPDFSIAARVHDT